MVGTAANGAWEKFTLHVATNRHLVALQFTRIMKKVKKAGKRKHIHNFACISDLTIVMKSCQCRYLYNWCDESYKLVNMDNSPS